MIRATEAKAFLLKELSPRAWKREVTPEEEARAVDTLKRILRYLRETPPGPRTDPMLEEIGAALPL